MTHNNIFYLIDQAENIMLDGKGHVKIVDFGQCTKLLLRDASSNDGSLSQPMVLAGSLPYMAPELIREHIGGRHTDWFAFGVLAYELFTGNSPWSSRSDKRKIISDMFKSPPVVFLPASHFTREAVDLVAALLRHDYRIRLGTIRDIEVKNARFFSSMDWDKLSALEIPPVYVPPPPSTFVNEVEQQAAMNSLKSMVYQDRNTRPITPP
jgi:serine/threonine protein kinase